MNSKERSKKISFNCACQSNRGNSSASSSGSRSFSSPKLAAEINKAFVHLKAARAELNVAVPKESHGSTKNNSSKTTTEMNSNLLHTFQKEGLSIQSTGSNENSNTTKSCHFTSTKIRNRYSDRISHTTCSNISLVDIQKKSDYKKKFTSMGDVRSNSKSSTTENKTATFNDQRKLTNNNSPEKTKVPNILRNTSNTSNTDISSSTKFTSLFSTNFSDIRGSKDVNMKLTKFNKSSPNSKTHVNTLPIDDYSLFNSQIHIPKMSKSSSLSRICSNDSQIQSIVVESMGHNIGSLSVGQNISRSKSWSSQTSAKRDAASNIINKSHTKRPSSTNTAKIKQGNPQIKITFNVNLQFNTNTSTEQTTSDT